MVVGSFPLRTKNLIVVKFNLHEEGIEKKCTKNIQATLWSILLHCYNGNVFKENKLYKIIYTVYYCIYIFVFLFVFFTFD